jgi:hypothetical protein
LESSPFQGGDLKGLGQNISMMQPQPSQANTNLNEDINMQLYGQISMFDQLTDYNDNDNDLEPDLAQHRRHYQREEGKGEDDDAYMDHGEDEAGNMFHYR